MATQTQQRTSMPQSTADAGYMRPEVREIRPTGDETKLSLKTTEFYIYLAAVAGVLIASQAVGTTNTHSDYFRADRAWLYIVALTIGYLLSRGLAKAGSSTRWFGRGREEAERKASSSHRQ